MGTPIRSKFSAVPGTILIHKKWQNSLLSQDLEVKFNRVSFQDLGLYDFCLSGDKFITFIPESNLVTTIDPEKYLEAAKNDSTITIAVRNTITAEQYSHLQDALVMNNNKKLIPIGDASEIPELLKEMAFLENTPQKLCKSQCSTNHPNILLNIPGLGKQKADKLLDTFGTINRIAYCSVSELSGPLGLNLAAEVYKYFH